MIVAVDVGSDECASCRPQLLTPVVRERVLAEPGSPIADALGD